MSNNKISAGLGFEPHQKLTTPKGLDWSQDFKDKIYDKEEEFRSQIILEINEIAGDDWGVNFIDFRSPTNNKFLVDIRAPRLELYQSIANIIVAKFPDMEFQFYSAHQPNSPFFQTRYFMNDRP